MYKIVLKIYEDRIFSTPPCRHVVDITYADHLLLLSNSSTYLVTFYSETLGPSFKITKIT